MSSEIEKIVGDLLANFAPVFYVSTPHQQERVVRDAAASIRPQLRALVQAEAIEMAANPS